MCFTVAGQVLTEMVARESEAMMLFRGSTKSRLAASRTMRRRGAAAAELALLLPTILILVLGCVDFGRFAVTYIAVTNAARAGAGFGAANPPTSHTLSLWRQKVTQAALDEIGGLGTPVLSQSSPPILNPAPPNPLSNDQVQVTVQMQFNTIIPWPGVPSSTTVTQVVLLPLIQ